MGTIGERIRALRKGASLTQPELAKAIGISQSTLSDIENGAGFSAEILMGLADTLGAAPDFIMRGPKQAASPALKKALKDAETLNDEERLQLLAAIQQPPVLARQAEESLSATGTAAHANQRVRKISDAGKSLQEPVRKHSLQPETKYAQPINKRKESPTQRAERQARRLMGLDEDVGQQSSTDRNSARPKTR